VVVAALMRGGPARAVMPVRAVVRERVVV